MQSALTELGARRDALLARLIERFEQDERVGSAWLSGSFGRGEADEWSDLDLHVAIQDADFDAVIANKDDLFAWGGQPLLIQAGFPSESMPGGRFWLVMYEGCVEVDWNIGPVSVAARPAASHIVFERQPVPVALDRHAASPGELREKLQSTVEFFWAMAPIAVKYAGRGHTRLGVIQCELLERAYQRLWELPNAPASLGDEFHQNRRPPDQADAAMPRFGPAITSSEVLRVAEECCSLVGSLHPELALRGVPIPSAMPQAVDALIAVARLAVESGGTRTGVGSRR
jgi:predicted nucleotidyltransferase